MIYYYEAEENTYGCFIANNDNEAMDKMTGIEKLIILYKEEIINEFITLYRRNKKCYGI